MPIYTYNSPQNYDQNAQYDAASYGGVSNTYDADRPYDSAVNYNGDSTVISVGVTQFSFTKYAPKLADRAAIIPPTKNLTLSAKQNIIINTGVGVLPSVKNLLITTSIDYFKISYVTFSGEPVPGQHVEDAQKLEADAYIELFEITLADKVTKLYLKLNKTGTWQGNTYEGYALKLDGVGKFANDEVARPKLSLYNPNGIYSSLVDSGQLDAATIVRYRLLKYDYDHNRPIYRRQQWKVSRVLGITSGVINLELRDLMDGQNFSVPGRMFIPPDFPTVGIQ